MSLQEIYDKVVAAMAAQGFERAWGTLPVKKSAGCLYFDPETGRTCAVGALIPRVAYRVEFEGIPADTLQRNCTNRPAEPSYDILGRLGVHGKQDQTDALELLGNLQIAHDESNTPERMRAAFRTVAEEMELKVPASLGEGEP